MQRCYPVLREMSLLHHSLRRPKPLKDKDYDHEILLVDHTSSVAPLLRNRSASARRASLSSPASLGTASDPLPRRRYSDGALPKKLSIRGELRRRKYSRFRDPRLDEGAVSDDEQPEVSRQDGEIPEAEERGRTRERFKRNKYLRERESAIDILFENQRGCFLCGIPLFSAKALGACDPAPWTNIADKTSATDITNAQVPDPSWEWAWKEWYVNHTPEVDEDGWEYSFAFAKLFSWHGPAWWNSFVRRRAWIRKRVKKKTGYRGHDARTFNEDYFTIYPAVSRARSRASSLTGSQMKRHSFGQLSKREIEVEVVAIIEDIASLMQALRFCRIDREKMEAVENFIEHGGDELYYLRERMHDIMRMFIFQASRRLLHAHLLKIFNEASDELKNNGTKEGENSVKQRRLDNLAAAMKHADEEVKKLEFWSDIKDMAQKGDTKGAADEAQGWDKEWIGLDLSGPTDVISNRNIPGMSKCAEGEGNGTAILSTSEKGKGKAKEWHS